MNIKDKLTEATMLALQGKLTEDNESKLSETTIMNWFKQCNLKPSCVKGTGIIECVYLNNQIDVIQRLYDDTYYIYYSSFSYIEDEVDKLISDEDKQLYRVYEKYGDLTNDIANDFYYKYPELKDDSVYRKPVTNENGLELIKQCKNLIDKTVNIVNKNLTTFVENALNELSNKPSKGNLKYNIVYYLNTATRERREETREDVDDDYCNTVEYFDTDLEAFEYVMTDILGLNPEDYYDAEETDEEKIKTIINYFQNQDYGDGEVIICKVVGKNYKYNSGLTKKSFYEM